MIIDTIVRPTLNFSKMMILYLSQTVFLKIATKIRHHINKLSLFGTRILSIRLAMKFSRNTLTLSKLMNS